MPSGNKDIAWDGIEEGNEERIKKKMLCNKWKSFNFLRTMLGEPIKEEFGQAE
jgi:hypothetical protein